MTCRTLNFVFRTSSKKNKGGKEFQQTRKKISGDQTFSGGGRN